MFLSDCSSVYFTSLGLAFILEIYDWVLRKKALYILYQKQHYFISLFILSTRRLPKTPRLSDLCPEFKHSHRSPSTKTKRHRTHQPNSLGYRQHPHPPRLSLNPLARP
jgi:hypothetical protein